MVQGKQGSKQPILFNKKTAKKPKPIKKKYTNHHNFLFLIFIKQQFIMKKKLNSKQKLAIERIYRLFELANEMNKSKFEDKEKYTKRYLSLAKKIGEKVNVSIPKELKKTFCKKCYSLNITLKENSPFLILECNDCKFTKKFSLK
jgi:ribonuclease P protein subunit RPR2